MNARLLLVDTSLMQLNVLPMTPSSSRDLSFRSLPRKYRSTALDYLHTNTVPKGDQGKAHATGPNC